MKKSTAIIISMLCLFMASASAQTVKLNLEEVKIYLSGAELTHTAKIKLKEGNNEILLDNIANNLVANSINANISGGAIIMDISEKRDYLAVAGASVEVKKLQDSVEAINLKITYLNNEIAALNAEEEILNQNKVMSTKEKSLTPAEIREMSKLYYESKLAISNSRVRIGIEINKLSEKSASIRKQISELNGGGATPVHQLALSAYSKSAQTVDLIIKYYINEASWSPFYDIRAKGVNKPIEFYRKANVRQNSGIDFKDVKLTLSTRNPSLYGEMPTVSPIALNFTSVLGLGGNGYYPMVSQYATEEVQSKTGGFSAEFGDTNVGMIRVDGLDANNPIIESLGVGGNGYYPSVTVFVSNYISAEFVAEVKYTIPSDGKPHHVELAPAELPATFEYYAAPKYRTESFLVAKIDDWESANLLQAEANVYYENSYIGKTGISPEVTTDTLSLSLGVDKNVIVKREALKDFTESKFLSSDIERTFAYKITVKNAKSEKIKITIEDQVPVSKNEEIKVKFIEGSGSEPDKDTGKVTWVAEIEPGKTLEKTLIYSVRHPSSTKIIGL